MAKNLNELQEEYEKEFSKFLIEKLNHAGGSLQFQHLSNLLQQLRFEVKGALGITKSGLMKFLRTHSTTFKINSEGNVTIANPSPLGVGYKIKSQIVDTKMISHPKIDNGTGYIFKIFPEFAIIKALTPVKTYIFFTPVEYGAEENSLFTNLDLLMDTEVGFNAIHGHSDYEIEYRATKVWRNDSDEEDATRVKKTKTNKFAGEGIIKQLFSVNGFISVSGKEDIFFYRTNCKDANIKVGDRVKFVAECTADKWQATEITKKKKEKVIEPPAHSQIPTGDVNKGNAPVSSNRIKDQPGKIFPYSKGAVIKFGKNESELADGNSCDFYLYSFKVRNSDLAMEFSEGDDIKFDAVKSKDSPGWKAVLAWVGEKPDIRDIDKKYFEEMDKNSRDPNEKLSAASSKVSAVPVETRKFNKNNYTINKKSNLNRKPHGSLNEKNLNGFSKQNQNSNSIDHKIGSKNLSHNDFKHNKNENKYKQINKKPINKYRQNKPYPRLTENYSKEENLNISKNTYLDTSEYECYSEENNELQDNLHLSRKFLKEDKECSVENSQSKYRERNVKDENYKNHKSKKKISTNEETSVKKKAKIKKYEDIDGKIIRLISKCAILESDSLTKNIECVLNAFYKDGKGAEDEQITDLKEVYRVGDSVTFNCFIIRDDFGDLHQKVTMAWQGPKPTAPETTPEAFISMHNLQVTLNDTYDDESESEKDSFDISRSPSPDEICEFDMEDSLNERVEFVPKSKEYISRLTPDDEFDYESESEKKSFDVSRSPSPSTICESDMENSLNERLTDDEYSVSRSQIDNTDQELLLSDVQHEALPNTIFKKLENYGFTFTKPEEGLDVIHEIIDLVLKNSNTEEYFNVSENRACAAKSNSKTICSSCAQRNKEVVTTKDTATQTIVTGEIVLTSIFPED